VTVILWLPTLRVIDLSLPLLSPLKAHGLELSTLVVESRTNLTLAPEPWATIA
jgi:hypothetical protein